MSLTLAENTFWKDFGYHRGETRVRNLPEVFAIESTNYCNIQCVMCPRGEPDIMTRPLGNMDTALFRKVLDEATFFSNPCWFHWFGEPLMNPDLFDQIALAKPRVPNLGISTNATLLHDRNTDRILASELDTLLVALDGATKEVYERTRKGPFEFEKVIGYVERFLERRRRSGRAKPHTILSIIVMEDTASDIEAFQAHWAARGADEVLVKPFVNWAGQADMEFLKLALPGQRAAIQTPRAHPCKTLWESVVIAWDGRVVPCCFDYDTKQVMGNVKTATLAEIWNSPGYVALRQAELKGQNFCDLCANCTQAPGHARDPNWGAKELLALRGKSKAA